MGITARGLVIGSAVVLAVAAGGATAGQRAAAAGQGFKVVGKWGKIGTTGDGVFSSSTRGIAVDASGNVYVADTDNRRVQVFSPTGKFLRKWGAVGAGNGQFALAEDVAIAPDGTVWVADDPNERVQQFSATGAFVTAIRLPKNELARGVAVDANGDVLVAIEGGTRSGYRRFTKTETGWQAKGDLVGLLPTHRADDVEASPDGSVYLVRAATQSADNRVQRFSSDGKLLGAFKLAVGDGARGLGVDLDCNVWTADTPNGGIALHSPTGKVLATGAADLIGNDTAVSPKGDLYVINQNRGIVHFAEDKAKPATANVPGTIRVANGKAKMRFGLPSVACPAQVDATATLTGKGVSGRATLKVGAGKFTVIDMNVKAPAGKTTPALFKIVLKTNGRPTTQTKAVKVSS